MAYISQINPLAYWEEDRHLICRYLGTVIIDNEPGWLVVEYHDGRKWAYAPMLIAWRIGEIAREI